jgi:peptide deformylase
MSIRSILHFPDPRLRQKALPVTAFDQELHTLVDDMFETMYSGHGIGLAATQINIQQRVIVIDLSDNKTEQLCLINPEILEKHDTEEMDVYESVQRADHIRLKALDRQGKPFEIDTGGLLAVCIQHEIDHLDGKLFVDYLSTLKRERIKKKLEKHRRAIL